MIENTFEIEIMIDLIQFNMYKIQMIKWLFNFNVKLKKMTINDAKLTLGSRLKIGNIACCSCSCYKIDKLAFQTMMIVKSFEFV